MEWYLRAHPDISVRPEAGGFELTGGGRTVAFLQIPRELRPQLLESTWHPGFNRTERCSLITASRQGRLPSDFAFELVWR
jgi:hypothetical protein